MEKTLVHLRENSLENQLLLEVGRSNLLGMRNQLGLESLLQPFEGVESVRGSIANAIVDAIENATSSSGDRPDV